jgi:glycosyltransferase involved in cell wall biosynthesis
LIQETSDTSLDAQIPTCTNPPDQQRVLILFGEYGDHIGGPFKTLSNYRDLLRDAGHDVHVGALSADSREHDSSVRLYRPHNLFQVIGIIRTILHYRRASIVVFGVWHLMFFLLGISTLLLPWTFRSCTLIPTHSLGRLDWAKHRFVKRVLRPAVTMMIKRYRTVMFASLGERATSSPLPTGPNYRVGYHPMKNPPIRPSGVGQAPFHLSFLGRISPEKDVPFLFQVLARLPERWVLQIVGSGEKSYVHALRAQAEALGVSERITWLGWLPPEKAYEAVGRSTFLTVASHSENYCHAAVEAMALGVPVIMLDRIASSVDFASAKCAAVCGSTPREMADEIARLADSSTDRSRLIAAGHRFAQARASQESHLQLLQALIQ